MFYKFEHHSSPSLCFTFHPAPTLGQCNDQAFTVPYFTLVMQINSFHTRTFPRSTCLVARWASGNINIANSLKSHSINCYPLCCHARRACRQYLHAKAWCTFVVCSQQRAVNGQQSTVGKLSVAIAFI